MNGTDRSALLAIGAALVIALGDDLPTDLIVFSVAFIVIFLIMEVIFR